MSSFTCKCGAVIREAEEPEGASGTLLSLTELTALEKRIAGEVADFMQTSGQQRAAWIRAHLGPEYPTDTADPEVVEDLVSQALNATGGSATFICPSCGRFAIAPGPKRDTWSFFMPE